MYTKNGENDYLHSREGQRVINFILHKFIMVHFNSYLKLHVQIIREMLEEVLIKLYCYTYALYGYQCWILIME
jgi:hypothetical protein